MGKRIPLITLTTDFGLADEYVGVMKGVILGLAPATPIVDLCHQIAPHAIDQAARLLAASQSYFPAGSLHVAVVDPGVGSSRRILVAEAAGQLFLAPDNGILTGVLASARHAVIRQVTRTDLFLPAVSRTFHGRDIFAPVAGHLAAGLLPSQVGPEIAAAGLATIELSRPALDPVRKIIAGRVTGSDRFGNLLTDIREEDLSILRAGQGGKVFLFAIAGHEIRGLAECYAAIGAGRLGAIIGSRGVVEIAAGEANAAQLLRPAAGEAVTVGLD